MFFLFGLRTHVRLDTKASPGEFIYGTILRVPEEFFLQKDYNPDLQIFINDFRQYMRQVKLIPSSHYKKRAFVFKELSSCSYVFLHNYVTIKKSLERLYSGPFRIIQRISDKVYSIKANGKLVNVSAPEAGAFFVRGNEQSNIRTSPLPLLRNLMSLL